MMTVEYKRLKLRIVGVPCASCVVPVRKEMLKTEGVRWVGANVVLDLLLIDYDPSVVNVELIIARIKHAGYTAVPTT